MYEETKDLIVRTLRTIVESDGQAVAVELVRAQIVRSVEAIENMARCTLKEKPNHPQAEELQAEMEILATMKETYTKVTRAIARNKHGELRNGLWIEYHTPATPDTSTAPKEIKDIYENALQALQMLVQQSRKVLCVASEVNPTDPDTTDTDTCHPCTYVHPTEYPDELTDAEVEQIRDYFAQKGYQVSRVAVWWQFVGWKVGAKSGYRDTLNNYHLFTPVHYNPFTILCTRLCPTRATWQTAYHL